MKFLSMSVHKRNKARLNYLSKLFGIEADDINEALTLEYGNEKSEDLSYYTDNDVKKALTKLN